MSYICTNCGGVFHEPIVSEDQKWFDLPLRNVSPCCSAAYSTAQKCDQCGQIVAEEKRVNGLCRKCALAALERFIWLLNNEFTDSERIFIDKCLEGNSLTEPNSIKVIAFAFLR